MDQEKVLKDATEALQSLRKKHEELQEGTVSKAQFQEMVEKTEKALEKQEEVSQANLAQELKNKKFEEDLKNLEKTIVLDSSKKGSSDYKNSDAYKGFIAGLKKGDFIGYESAMKALNRTDINVDGGYLVPEFMANEIIKEIIEVSPMRQLARVTTIGSKSITIPKRTTILSASFEGETEEANDSTSKYGSETLTPYRQSVTVPVTHDLLMDSMFNFENEVQSDVAISFAQNEGDKFLNGDGVKKPEGILTNTDIVAAARDTATANIVAFDDLINLSGDLKTGYNGMYTFSRTTNAYLRTLKGTNGQYLWQVQGGGSFNTLNGFAYMLDNQMPNDITTTGSIPILFADFSKGYRIIDRTDMMVIRDDFTQKNRAIVEFNFKKWTTGKVVLAEAIKALKVS